MVRKNFRKGELSEDWPFTVDEVQIIRNGQAVFVKIDDHYYSLNGMAYEHTKIPFPHEAGLQASINRDGIPPFVSVDPYIQAGLQLMEELM